MPSPRKATSSLPMNRHFALSESDEWYTPPELVRLWEELATSPIVDYFGENPFWSEKVPAPFDFMDGVQTFLYPYALKGSSVFANPPYGGLYSSYHMTTNRVNPDLRPDFIEERATDDRWEYSIPVPKSFEFDFIKGDDGFFRVKQDCGWKKGGKYKYKKDQLLLTHHKGTQKASLYLLDLWKKGLIKESFLIIPSAVDTTVHRTLMREVGWCMNTQRLPFYYKIGDDYVAKQGNTKGTSLFWMSPKEEISPKEAIKRLSVTYRELEIPFRANISINGGTF